MGSWQLKTAGGIFTAESDERLLEWARLGRIQPGQTVRNDGGEWQSVGDVGFLDMKWSIDIGDGRLHGPYNRQAAEKLLETGRLPKKARLLGPAPELLGEIESLKSEISSLKAGNEAILAEKGRLEESLGVNEALSAANAALVKERDALLAERDSITGERDALLSERDALSRERDTLREKCESLASDKGRMDAERRSLEESKAGLEKALKDEQGKSFALTGELKRLPENAEKAAEVEAAVYALMQAEREDLDAELADLDEYYDKVLKARNARRENIAARRRELVSRIGSDPGDMVQRALAERREDPRMAYLRQERDALKILQEKGQRESDFKIRELEARLREARSEADRLRLQSGDITLLNRQLSDFRQRLQQREKELMDERRMADEFRKRAETTEQALLARISTLESGLPGSTMQSREAHQLASRFPPWMGLKK